MEHISNHLTVAAVNKELAQQEQTPSRVLASEERSFLEARQSIPIANETVENIDQLFRRSMMKVGIRAANIPSHEETFVLYQHLIKNYGGHTIAEIDQAFDLALSGKLETDAKHYENFSCAYLSEILNAYRAWAAQVHRQQMGSKTQHMEQQKESLSDQAMNDWLEDTRKRKLAVEFMPVMLYDFIDRKKMIVLSNDEKYEYLQRAASFRLSKLQKDHETNPTAASKKLFDEFLRMKTDGAIEGEEIDVIKNLAKKMVVYDYLYGSKT